MSRFNETRLIDNQPLNRESRMQKYEFNNQQEYSAFLESEVNQFGWICHGNPNPRGNIEVFEMDSLFIKLTYVNYV